MSSRTIAFIAIVSSALLWSTSGAVSKLLLKENPPFPLAFLRFAIASIAILPLFLKQKSHTMSVLIRDLGPLSLLSALNIVFFYIGLTKTTANAAAIIYTVTPLTSAVIARIRTGERMRKNKLLGIGIGLFGALLISLLPVLEKGSQINGDILGNLFIFFAMVFWAIYTIGSQHAIRRGYSPITITSMSLFVSAFIFCIITLLTYHGNLLISFSRPDTLLLLLHLSLLVTVATYLLYQWAIKHSSGTTASLNIYLQPVFGLGINALLLGERVTTGLLIGSTFVILGVVLATKRK